MAEKDFVQELKTGNQAAFKALVEQYKRGVLNTCYRFLFNQHDSEDIAQEVFIEIYQSVHNFRSESKLSTWVYRIAVTKCLDEIKKRQRKKRLISIGKMLHLDEVANRLAGGEMPQKNFEETEFLQEIQTVLNTLPDNQRVAFTLSKIDGFTNAEIADIMNTTTVAIESLVYRAKKQISDDLESILKNKG